MPVQPCPYAFSKFQIPKRIDIETEFEATRLLEIQSGYRAALWRFKNLPGHRDSDCIRWRNHEAVRSISRQLVQLKLLIARLPASFLDANHDLAECATIEMIVCG